MAAHIALLRGVNVGGANRLAMADLRRVAGEAGLANARTFLQSGNLVFEAAGESASALEARLEAALAESPGLATEVMIRSAEDWRTIIAANPLAAEAQRAPQRLLLFCLKASPTEGAQARLDGACRGGEIARLSGREAFIFYPDGQGASRLAGAAIDRALGGRATGRNWNTVLKLATLSS